MPSMTNFLENELIDHLFRGRAYAQVSTLWVGLFTAAPSDTGGGTEVATAGNSSYWRAPVVCTYSTWQGTGAEVTDTDSAGTGGTASNNNSIAFNTPNANWGTVTHFAILNSYNIGNMLIWGSLTANKTINVGDPAPYFAVGDLDFTIDD